MALRANKFPDDPDEKAEDIRGKEDYQKVAEYAEKNLTDDETFAELEQLVDIDNMIQYFAIETYIANSDFLCTRLFWTTKHTLIKSTS